jgi:hypothetical protein
MSDNDNYLLGVVSNHKAPSIEISDRRIAKIVEIVTAFAGAQLQQLLKSGSSAKGTAVRGTSDIDLFISLKSDTTYSLADIYNMLDSKLKSNGIATRRQNVSIGITYNSLDIDLVPGKIQSGYSNYHSIYVSKKDTWMQTNVKANIDLVTSSNRISEIILGKIWRKLHALDFPSVYLELTFIQALKHKSNGDVANNFYAALQFLRDTFIENAIIDPSNSNNKISETLTATEKNLIKAAATESLSKKIWGEIVW